VPNVDRDVPPPAAPPAQQNPASASGKRPLGYQSTPRTGGADIDFAADGSVSVRVNYEHDRAWGLVIGFGVLAAGLTALIVYDTMAHDPSRARSGVIVGAVVCALLALAAAIRGGTPPLQVIASADGVRMQGGVINEELEWRRDEVLAVTAEDLEQPHTNNARISVVLEFRGDEFATFPVATREEQAAIVQALRGALKLPAT